VDSVNESWPEGDEEYESGGKLVEISFSREVFQMFAMKKKIISGII
jgi:hypothetical protein